jgi:hypothetical protein
MLRPRHWAIVGQIAAAVTASSDALREEQEFREALNGNILVGVNASRSSADHRFQLPQRFAGVAQAALVTALRARHPRVRRWRPP